MDVNRHKIIDQNLAKLMLSHMQRYLQEMTVQ